MVQRMVYTVQTVARLIHSFPHKRQFPSLTQLGQNAKTAIPWRLQSLPAVGQTLRARGPFSPRRSPAGPAIPAVDRAELCD